MTISELQRGLGKSTVAADVGIFHIWHLSSLAVRGTVLCMSHFIKCILMAQKVLDGKTFHKVGFHRFYFKNDQGKLSLKILAIDGKPALFFPMFYLLFYF